MKLFLLTVLNSILMVAGQMFWKLGMTNKTVNSIFDILCLLFSPLIFIGLAIYACATILWLYILSKADLSFVYPIQSLAYVFALFLAFFLFKENVSLNRWLGTIVICFGVYLISIK